MTTLLADPRERSRDAAALERRPEWDGVGGEPTLDAFVSAAWEGLAAHAVAACLVCPGALRARYGAGAAPVAGRCESCGAQLS